MRKKIKLCDFPRKYDMKLNQNVTKIARMCQWLSPLFGFVKPNILCKMKTFQCVKNTFFFINTSHSTHILWYWTCLETQKCWRETYTLEHKKQIVCPNELVEYVFLVHTWKRAFPRKNWSLVLDFFKNMHKNDASRFFKDVLLKRF